MSLQPLIPFLVSMLAGSVAVMVWAATGSHKLASAAAAGVFALVVVVASVRINLPLIARTVPYDGEAAIHASRRNARLMALTYAWGGAAMLAVYFLSGLWWWHSWQYGGAMALIAASLLGFVHQAGDPDSHLRTPRILSLLAMATAVQGLAAATGVALLVRSGKPWIKNTDWVANQVFLAGGTAIAVLSAIAVLTHLRIVAAPTPAQKSLNGA